jgi:hypothetical protein
VYEILLAGQTYRAEFGEEIVGQLGQALAVRVVCRVRCRPEKASTTMSPT